MKNGKGETVTTWHLGRVQEQAEQAAAFQELEEEVQAGMAMAVFGMQGSGKRHMDSKM